MNFLKGLKELENEIEQIKERNNRISIIQIILEFLNNEGAHYIMAKKLLNIENDYDVIIMDIPMREQNPTTSLYHIKPASTNTFREPAMSR